MLLWKNQINEAIQYYEEYIGKYDETYIEEIYYKLALAYENIDLNKSKEYANYIKINLVIPYITIAKYLK